MVAASATVRASSLAGLLHVVDGNFLVEHVEVVHLVYADFLDHGHLDVLVVVQLGDHAAGHALARIDGHLV